DSEKHQLKDMAELFITAMSDWPTYNLNSIKNYISELYIFYGEPITLEKIDSKNIDLKTETDISKFASGSSIAEMIQFSKFYYNETDFENIIALILNHYFYKRAGR